MKHVHHILSERIHRQAGLVPPPAPRFRFEDLVRSEWSPAFEQLMRNRLLMGALRYGRISENRGKPYDRIRDAMRRLERYEVCGNLEDLVDAANLALLEFECGVHPRRHFSAADDGQHCPLNLQPGT